MVVGIIGYTQPHFSVTATTSAEARGDITIINGARRYGRTYAVSCAYLQECYIYNPPEYKFYQDYHALQVCFPGKILKSNQTGRRPISTRLRHGNDKVNNKRKFYIQKLTKQLWQA